MYWQSLCFATPRLVYQPRGTFITRRAVCGGTARPRMKLEVVSVSTTIDVIQEHDDIIYPQVLPFLLVHVGCVAAIWSGVTWQAIAICVVLYWLRMFAIGAGYHRYFSHRA